ncbi:hypothetical protein [Pedobacter gandavensis]|uniref:hypothetical protein n=1 Tax=Pedobacter gandavensis TaxID=2679963 RepID=UPI0029308825|nr:hypothetical protein [Pedobacter gandavensis]
MQDKDFDQLFKDKFEEAEMMPSADLWGNIEKVLSPTKKKRVFPVYWAAAALAVIAVSVGLLTRDTEKLQLQGKPAVALEKTPAVQDSGDASGLAHSNETSVVSVAVNSTESEGTPLILAPKMKLKNLVQENNSLSLQRNDQIRRHQIKAVEPSNTLKEEVKPIIDLPTENVIANVVIPDVQQGDNTMTETEDRGERKGIRNVGDVINFVVDKLDKREKKFIQFKTDDDDNSSLIAVNIGILKFNSKRNK